MNAKGAFFCAVMLASSWAAYTGLAPHPPNAIAEREREPASDRHARAPSPPPLPTPASTATPLEPHPITAVRAAIAAQSSLFLEIETALAAADVARVKRLLEEHEQRFPDLDGGAEARQGYAAIARCIESPGAESRASGERFVADHRASPLRRKVRRACLGARTPVMLPPA